MMITRIVEDRKALFLAIENFASIALAYGDEVAAQVAEQVRHCAYALSQGGVTVQPLSPSILTLHRGEDATGMNLLAIEELCTLVSATPFHVHGAEVMASVSLHHGIDAAQSACRQHAVPLSGDQIARYCADMELAVRFVKHAGDGDLLTLWRPVRSNQLLDMVLHYEAVTRLFEPSGRHRDCSAEHEALQRLGMAWVYDRAILMNAIDELYADARPCISVQLSPQGLRETPDGQGARWLGALRRLEARPDVAARLTIEICGTFAGTSIESVRDRIARFRQLGCSLSVADFASSDLNFGALLTLDPDIVKLSPVFLQAAAMSPANCRRLQLLFKLAGTLSRKVVVTGVDGERHMQIARALGADWVKGLSIGEPAFGRHWKIVQTDRRRAGIEACPANSDPSPATVARAAFA